MEKNAIKIKLSVIGDECTGKSIFLKYLNNNKLDKSEYVEYIPTSGAAYFLKRLIYKNKIYSFEFWDNAGNIKYRSLNMIFVSNSKVILIFYNHMNRNSFETAKELISWSKDRCINNPIYVLVCNKYQLNMNEKTKNIVRDEEVLEYAEKNDILFSHISIFDKYEDGINELFIKILNKYIQNK